MALGVAQVHPQQLRAKRAASSPPAPWRISTITSFSSDGSRGRSRTLSTASELGLALLELGDLVAGHRRISSSVSESRISRAPGQLVGRLGQLAVGAHDRLEPAELLAQPADRGDVGRGLGQGRLGLQLVVLAGPASTLASRSVSLIAAGRRARGRRQRLALEHRRCPAGTASPSARIACSIDTIATSIMSSVGCLVVIIWIRIPGYITNLMIGFERCRPPSRRSS